jgi:hypothetical protein
MRFMRSSTILRALAPFIIGATLGVACSSGSGSLATDAGTNADGSASPDAASTDGAVSADGTVLSDGAVCVTIAAASYDRSCGGDSDCALIPVGTLCSGGCGCQSDTVNKNDAAKVSAALAGVKLQACPCAAPGTARCVANVCTLCTFGPTNPPGCPDGG